MFLSHIQCLFPTDRKWLSKKSNSSIISIWLKLLCRKLILLLKDYLMLLLNLYKNNHFSKRLDLFRDIKSFACLFKSMFMYINNIFNCLNVGYAMVKNQISLSQFSDKLWTVLTSLVYFHPDLLYPLSYDTIHNYHVLMCSIVHNFVSLVP